MAIRGTWRTPQHYDAMRSRVQTGHAVDRGRHQPTPQHVLEERDRRAELDARAHASDLNVKYLGDPAPDRSALAQKQALPKV
jgi:hypothetical protein